MGENTERLAGGILRLIRTARAVVIGLVLGVIVALIVQSRWGGQAGRAAFFLTLIGVALVLGPRRGRP